MKAIIDIKNKQNQYSKLNGLTFKVKELLNNGVGLLAVNPYWPSNQTDFTFEEVIIVDIEKEVEYYFNTWEGERLKKYCESKGLDIKIQLPPAQQGGSLMRYYMNQQDFNKGQVPQLPEDLVGPKLYRLIQITAFCNGLDIIYSSHYFYAVYLVAVQQN